MARELENSSGLAHMLFIQGFMFDTLAHSTAESGIRKSKKASPAASAVFMFAIPAAVEATNGVSAQLYEQATRVRACPEFTPQACTRPMHACRPTKTTHALYCSLPCQCCLWIGHAWPQSQKVVAANSARCQAWAKCGSSIVVKPLTQRVWPAKW